MADGNMFLCVLHGFHVSTCFLMPYSFRNNQESQSKCKTYCSIVVNISRDTLGRLGEMLYIYLGKYHIFMYVRHSFHGRLQCKYWMCRSRRLSNILKIYNKDFSEHVIWQGEYYAMTCGALMWNYPGFNSSYRNVSGTVTLHELRVFWNRHQLVQQRIHADSKGSIEDPHYCFCPWNPPVISFTKGQ